MAVKAKKKMNPMSAEPFLPAKTDYSSLKEASKGCRGCPLYRNAIQAVFGEGSLESPLVLIGEQPGADEDKQGRPFVGAAGRLLNKALEEAGISRQSIYITNAVKHFKHKQAEGRKRSLPPTQAEIRACSPWLNAELALLKAKVLVCLGVSAAKSLLSGSVSLQKLRGRLLEGPRDIRILVTAHPASIFRHRDREERHRATEELVRDLRKAWKCAKA